MIQGINNKEAGDCDIRRQTVGQFVLWQTDTRQVTTLYRISWYQLSINLVLQGFVKEMERGSKANL